MLKFFSAIFFLMIVLTTLVPDMAHAEFEVPEHRWTLGYESGITLRRFLGENWEIYLGGGPDDSKSESDEFSTQNQGNEPPVPHSHRVEDNKTESGYIHIGVGRQVLREDRFWLTAFLGLHYRWENFQYKSQRTTFSTDRIQLQETIGHRMATTVSLGLRPAYDISSRVFLLVRFGIHFRSSTETKDTVSENFNGSQWTTESRRYSPKGDSVGLFGYSRLYSSIGFVFRF